MRKLDRIFVYIEKGIGQIVYSTVLPAHTIQMRVKIGKIPGPGPGATNIIEHAGYYRDCNFDALGTMPKHLR